ncbi:hypothetical protein LFZ5_18845 [Salmonella enterica subsp. enterica serovar Apapa str. SA20060561]|nr:hypothetical protein LFZ5_18845 [Salmonella enterica subsp. enterica serovar Apapa str. SA20060561]
MENRQHNSLNASELFRLICRYFMLTSVLFFVYLYRKAEYYLFLID